MQHLQCRLCHETIPSPLSIIPCGHDMSFHTGCFYEMIKAHHWCPDCHIDIGHNMMCYGQYMLENGGTVEDAKAFIGWMIRHDVSIGYEPRVATHIWRWLVDRRLESTADALHAVYKLSQQNAETFIKGRLHVTLAKLEVKDYHAAMYTRLIMACLCHQRGEVYREYLDAGGAQLNTFYLQSPRPQAHVTVVHIHSKPVYGTPTGPHMRGMSSMSYD